MKQKLVVSLLTVVLFCIGTVVFAQVDINDHRSCVNCGMDRKAYGYSRMLIHYEDGVVTGVCSLHCAVIELDANQGRKVKTLQVADRDTRMLIDVEQANWVMGGTKRGVMTQRPKWAFQSLAAAEAFIKTNGGRIVTWTEVLAAAREDMVRDR